MVQSIFPVMGNAEFEIITATHPISSAGAAVPNLNYSIEREFLVSERLTISSYSGELRAWTSQRQKSKT